MFDTLKANWQTLRESPPGFRFRRYHEARSNTSRHPLKRPLLLMAGVGLVVIGLILMPAPGPGTLVVLAGACILAGESRGVAVMLDRTEARLQHWWRRLRGRGPGV